MQSITNKLTSDIVDFLLRHGCFAWRQNTTGLYNPKSQSFRPAPKAGVSDILAVLPPNGTLLAIEVKTGRDTLRPAQEGFLSSVKASGGHTLVVHNFIQFEEFIKPLLPNAKKTKIKN